MTYRITLHDYPGLAVAERRSIEAQYRQTLEHALGCPGGVLLAWRAWQRAERADGQDIPVSDWHVARRWLLAADRARAAALGGLPDVVDASFELRPE